MTVADLIEMLKDFPSSARVVTPGFDEMGLDDIATVAIVRIKLDANPDSVGPHAPVRENQEPDEEAVLIDWS